MGARVRPLFEALGSRLAVHARWPGEPGRRLWVASRTLRDAAAGTGGRVVVNGRPDVALSVAGVYGAQMGARSLPVGAARALVGDRLRLGASVHDPAEAVAAARDGADWLVVGTIFSTPTHPERSGAGPEALTRCRAALDEAGIAVPVLAIGGVDADRARAVREAGAYGAAVVRAVWESPDPAAAALKLLHSLGG